MSASGCCRQSRDFGKGAYTPERQLGAWLGHLSAGLGHLTDGRVRPSDDCEGAQLNSTLPQSRLPMRSFFVSACLVSTMCAGIAVAQSPVAYVYVAEDTSNTTITSPISAYAASTEGKLTPLPGSPYTHTTGVMIGTNGTHFLTLDGNYTTTHNYVHVYKVGSNGVIGEEVSKQDLHEWCQEEGGGVLDHTGQYVYLVGSDACDPGYLSFALSKSGQLTFRGSLGVPVDAGVLPVFSGNDKFAYNFVPTPGSGAPCPTNAFIGLGRESSGALENISFSETDPTPPAGGYQTSQLGLVTDDPTNHLASLVTFQEGDCGQSGPTQTGLASYTIESNGDLVSTNTWENVAPLGGDLSNGWAMKMNAAGNIFAITLGTGLQFFHFNGANPITPFSGKQIIGDSGYINAMDWDGDNHLYALNGKSGKLHVYSATQSGFVVEAPGSPYLPINNCTAGGCSPQNIIVRRIP